MPGRVVPLITTTPLLGEAAAAFLGQPDLAASTCRSYQQTLGRLGRDLGADQVLGTLTVDQLTAAVTAAWGGRAPATWNRRVATARSFWRSASDAASWPRTSPSTSSAGRSWLTAPRPSPGRAPTAVAPRRRRVREKALCRLLYETAARASEDDGGHKRVR